MEKYEMSRQVALLAKEELIDRNECTKPYSDSEMQIACGKVCKPHETGTESSDIWGQLQKKR